MMNAEIAVKSERPLILVVEDDDDLRGILCGLLVDEGYRAEGAVHGAAALTRIRDGMKPAVILLDLMMPVMNGWAMISELKSDPALASIPVIVTTGGGDRVLFSAPVSAAYLNKPLTRERLLEVISLCLLRTQTS